MTVAKFVESIFPKIILKKHHQTIVAARVALIAESYSMRRRLVSVTSSAFSVLLASVTRTDVHAVAVSAPRGVRGNGRLRCRRDVLVRNFHSGVGADVSRKKRVSKRRWKARCALGQRIPMTAIVEHRLDRWFVLDPINDWSGWYTVVA